MPHEHPQHPTVTSDALTGADARSDGGDAPTSRRFHRRFLHRLQDETFAGALLLGAAVLALLWANSPWRGAYQALAGLEVGPAALHLNLSLSTWAADGLLAIFFFVVGL